MEKLEQIFCPPQSYFYPDLLFSFWIRSLFSLELLSHHQALSRLRGKGRAWVPSAPQEQGFALFLPQHAGFGHLSTCPGAEVGAADRKADRSHGLPPPVLFLLSRWCSTDPSGQLTAAPPRRGRWGSAPGMSPSAVSEAQVCAALAAQG